MTPLPAVPNRGDSRGFAATGNNFVAALPRFVTEANALQADVAAKQIIASAAAGFASVSSAAAEASASAAASGAATATSAASSASASALEAANLEEQVRYIAQQIVIDGNYGIVGMTGYKINLMNLNGTVLNWITTTSTSSKTWTFPDREGIVALASEVPAAYKSPIGGSTGKFSPDWIDLSVNLPPLKVLGMDSSINYSVFGASGGLRIQGYVPTKGVFIDAVNSSAANYIPITLHGSGINLEVDGAASLSVTDSGVSVVGLLGVGTPTPRSKISLGQAGTNSNTPGSGSSIRLYDDGENVVYGFGVHQGGGLDIAANQTGMPIRFFAGTPNSEPSLRATINGAGNLILHSSSLLIGADAPYSGSGGLRMDNTLSTQTANNMGFWLSASDACLKVGSMLNSRSINAAGTINAAGADYAEYMRKSPSCGIIAKGQIVGIDGSGHVTDKWFAAISFAVKTTKPSLVGGDIWGCEDVVGKCPTAPIRTPDETEQRLVSEAVAATDATPAIEATYQTVVIRPGDTDQEWAAKESVHSVAMAEFDAQLEAARQGVDRISFCGQVPVNVYGAEPGQYVVPVRDGDGIAGIAMIESDMTLVQYMRAVGKVIAIEADGRARIIVKVA